MNENQITDENREASFRNAGKIISFHESSSAICPMFQPPTQTSLLFKSRYHPFPSSTLDLSITPSHLNMDPATKIKIYEEPIIRKKLTDYFNLFSSQYCCSSSSTTDLRPDMVGMLCKFGGGPYRETTRKELEDWINTSAGRFKDLEVQDYLRGYIDFANIGPFFIDGIDRSHPTGAELPSNPARAELP